MNKLLSIFLVSIILIPRLAGAQQHVLPLRDSIATPASVETLTPTTSAVPLETTPYWQSIDSLFYATGMVWEDCNRDGWIDLFISNGNDMARARNAIYLSDEGRLPRAASWYSVNFEYTGHGAAGDIDDNGFPDFLVANFLGEFRFATGMTSEIYMNSTGIPETSSSWQTADSMATFSCALGDPDNDGDLDAAFATGTAYEDYLHSPDRIHFNDNGTLQTLPGWMSSASTNAMDVTWGDVDNDGDLDLAICYDLDATALFYNNDGVIESTPSWRAAEVESGNTLIFGDINNDGWLDLIVAGNNQFGDGGYFRAYFNNGSGQLNTSSGWQSATAGFGSALGLYDYDNDGDDDLAAGRWFDRLRVYENIGGTFTTTPVWRADIATVPEEISWIDVDRDGCEPWADTVSADGIRKLFYTRKHPLYSIDSVVADNVSLQDADYCYDLVSGWVSLSDAPSSELVIYYQYSYRNDLAISNWDTRNMIFGNTFWKVDMFSSVSYGQVPLLVVFFDNSIGSTEWLWDFGDGYTSEEKDPIHIYSIPGAYDVSLTVTLPDEIAERTVYDMILAMADTLAGDNVVAPPGDAICLTVRGRNTLPLHRIDIPLEFGGDIPLQYDSFSTVGCRTDYFALQDYIHWDAYEGKRVNARLRLASDGSQPALPPGEGPLIKFHFTLSPTAGADLTNVCRLDGYVSGANEYQPMFYSELLDWLPWQNDGSISTPCCRGIRGNLDGDAGEEITIDDVIFMVDWAFNHGPLPACVDEADVNGVDGVNIEDLVYLVECVFHAGDEPVTCY